MSDRSWSPQDKVIFGLMMVLGGLIMLSHFNIATSTLLIAFVASVASATVLLVWVSHRAGTGGERAGGKSRSS